jgi:hypothetical protein
MSIIQGNSKSASGFNTGVIEDSVWLDGTADLFSKTSFASNAHKKIISAWVRRNAFSSFGLLRGTDNPSGDRVGFGDNTATNQVYIVVNGKNLYSNASFRDVGWYHYLASFDLNESGSDKVKVFINGLDVDVIGGWEVDERSTMGTSFATFNNASATQQIGRDGASSMYLNAYLAQYCEIDGKSIQSGELEIADFLESFEFGTGSQFGPKSNADLTALTADAGSNSFALDFSDSSYLGHDSRPHNFIKHSEALGSWTDSHSTVVNNALVAPDGSQTMDTVEVVAGATYQWANRSQGFTVELSTLYTISVHMKHSGSNRTLINYMNPSSPYTSLATLYHNWSGGTPTQHAFSGTGATGTPVLENVGNDIWRISFQVMSSSTATNAGLAIYPNAGFTGNDPVGVWGIQFEQGGTLGNYVPTPKNLLLRTEEFDNSYWTKVAGSTATANQTVAPDGTTTADLMTAGNAAYGGLVARKSVDASLIPVSTQFTASIHCKKTNHRYIGFRLPSSVGTSNSANTYTFFDFDTAAFTVHGTLDSTSVEALGNSWYRIAVTGTLPGTNTSPNLDFALTDSAGSVLATPAGTETVYFWGAQFETGGLSTYRKISSTAAINVVPNNFTPNSITAVNQSTNTPSLVYATMDVLKNDGANTSTMVFSEGNTRVTGTGGSDGGAFSTLPLPTSGTTEFQATFNNGDGVVGICCYDNLAAVSSSASRNAVGGLGVNYNAAYGYQENGEKVVQLSSGVTRSAQGAALTTNSVLTVRYNADDNEITFLKDNVVQGSAVSTVAGLTYYAFVARFNNYDITLHFDSADFPHTIGSGNLEINSANQPTPTLQGVDNFSVTLGTESAVAPIVNLFRVSENISTIWSGSGTETLDAAPNPVDGVISADLAVRSATNGKFEQGHDSDSSNTASYTPLWFAGQRYIHSMYIKNVSVSTGQTSMHCWGVTGSYAGRLLISWTGSVPSLGSLTGSAADAIFENLGDGWYRISYSLVLNNAGQHYDGFEVSTAGTGESAYVWGSQLELSNSSSNKIDDSGSTLSGNMTGGGGLSAIFDLDTSKNNLQSASGANTNSNDSFVVVDHGSAKTIEQFVAYASTDAQGFDGDSGASTITFTLAGSTDNFSSSNVALFTGTVADGAGAVHTVSTGITRGAYRYHKMTVQTQTLNANEKFGRLAQLEFYEGATAPSTYVPTYTSGFASLPSTHKLDLIDTTTTENYIRNNTMEGVVAGTPGTLPTNWHVQNYGNTSEVVGSGVTDDGIEYVDIKFAGTPSNHPYVDVETATQIATLSGERWTFSSYVALVAGDMTNVSGVRFSTNSYNSSGSYVAYNGDITITPTSALVRHEFPRTTTGGATVAYVKPKLNIMWDGSGAIDITIRIGNPQMERRSHASPVIKTGAHTTNSRTSLNSFVEIQKNRSASETWAWRFSHDYDKEYAVSTTNTYQDIRDQTGTNNWVSYALKIAEASGTAAGAVSHGFASGNTVVTHGLTSSRYAVFLFPRNGGDIYVYHPDAATGELLILNSSAADAASTRIRDVTSTTFSIADAATTGVYDYLVLDDNGSSSALGKYIGNASSGGPYIATGHRPRWLWIKRLDAANSWVLQDTARHTFNPVDSYLQAESDSDETATSGDVDFLADGFKIRTASGNAWNASGGSYAYISIGDLAGGGSDLPPVYGK